MDFGSNCNLCIFILSPFGFCIGQEKKNYKIILCALLKVKASWLPCDYYPNSCLSSNKGRRNYSTRKMQRTSQKQVKK